MSEKIRSAWSVKTAAVLSASALLLTACGGDAEGGDGAAPAGDVPTDGVLRLGILNDLSQPPDPDVHFAGNGLPITNNAYEGLVRYALGNHDGEIEPLLATDWEINEDFTEFTFQLREGVVFHDGTPFDASAVAPSFERRVNVDAGPAYMTQGVAEVIEEDDYTVTVVLEEPNSAFLDFLASPFGPRMLSPTVLEEEAGDDFAQSYIAENSAGTGPYELTRAVIGDGYEMQFFEDYWDDIEPDFTTIEFSLYNEVSASQLELENGDLHAMMSGIPMASRQGYLDSDELAAYSLPSFQLGVLYMNPNREILAEAEDRVTFFQGFDWDSLVDQVIGHSAVTAEGNYPQGALSEHEDRILEHNAEAFEAWAAENQGQSIQIGHGSASPDSEQIANLMAAQLQEHGLDASVTAHQGSEVHSFSDDPASAPDVHVASGTFPDANNPYMHGHIFWGENGGLNHLQCYTEEIDELLDQGLVTGDPDIYNDAGEAAYDHGCHPTFAWVDAFMVTQPWIGGVEESHNIAAPTYLNFSTLTIEGE